MSNEIKYKIVCKERSFNFTLSSSTENEAEFLILDLIQKTIKKIELKNESLKIEDIMILALLEISEVLVLSQLSINKNKISNNFNKQESGNGLQEMKDEITMISSFLKEIICLLN